MGLDEVTEVCRVTERFNTESQRTLSGSYTESKYTGKNSLLIQKTHDNEKYFLTYKADNGLIYSMYKEKSLRKNS